MLLPRKRRGASVPIKPELRWFYPIDWPQISRQVRFERAAAFVRTGRPHGMTVRCLPDGRWFDTARHTWRDDRGRPAQSHLLTLPTRTLVRFARWPLYCYPCDRHYYKVIITNPAGGSDGHYLFRRPVGLENSYI
jgi:hypothetical protein